MLFFVLVTGNKQNILNTVDYFFLLLSFLLWEKRKERGRKEEEWQTGKENRRDAIFIEKREYLGKNNQEKRCFSWRENDFARCQHPSSVTLCTAAAEPSWAGATPGQGPRGPGGLRGRGGKQGRGRETP